MSRTSRDYTKQDGKWPTNDRLGLCLDVINSLDFIQVVLESDYMTEEARVKLANSMIDVLSKEIVERM